jgi:protein Tex
MSMPSPDTPAAIDARVARELTLPQEGVQGALALFRDGATLPFIARYRKEATGGLDEVQLRDVRDRAEYLEGLEARRAAILDALKERDELTGELERKLLGAQAKQELEDLYRPFRPKRRTRGRMAQERGLEPLAELMKRGELSDGRVQARAGDFVNPDQEVPDPEAALQGARDILAEEVAEEPGLRHRTRELLRKKGVVRSWVLRGKSDGPSAQRFRDYFDRQEPLSRIAYHRVLAMRRGKNEGILNWQVEGPTEPLLSQVVRQVVGGRAPRNQLTLVARDVVERLLIPSIGSELAGELEDRADAEAIRIFGQNLEQLLLQPPAGRRTVLGLDPGFRSGVKVALVSPTGAVLETDTLFLHQEEGFQRGIRALVDTYAPELVAVGNGTASRETEMAVREALARRPGAAEDEGRSGPATVVVVNEAGASVYSASDVAREELPELDVSLRGAVSIARRLQDPLAELVKIDPQSIGVGQYQHDVDQGRLGDRLDEVVEICVNRVGVELNTSSAALLSHVAGVGPTLATRIVELRDARGGLTSRNELLDVPRLGRKTFEQAAGFLRIRDGSHPLDRTGVHPERYTLVETMARDMGLETGDLMGNEEALGLLEERLPEYRSMDVGLPTLQDILDELRRPGRDPRDAFEAPSFREDVRSPEDLSPGMKLEGVVTNVVAFGAFVDIGVHQDGLVHISQLADRFVREPAEVVTVGQRVRVRVLSIDLERGRIGLSMKSAGSN